MVDKQALAIYRKAGNRAAEGLALNNLTFVWKALQNHGISIIYGMPGRSGGTNKKERALDEDH